MRIITIAILILTSSDLLSQHLDVEGHSRIRGSLDLSHMDDSTTILIGTDAGIQTNFDVARSNTFVGSSAGRANESGSYNSFFGRWSGDKNTAGSSNSFYGFQSGFANTDGYENSFFGRSGSSNTTGWGNSFFGYTAGFFNETGVGNSFFGHSAGYHNNATSNSFFGFYAGINNTTGHFNSYFGSDAGVQNSTGSNNSLFGYFSGYYNSGSNNSFFGYRAGQDHNLGDGNTFLGFQAAGSESTAFNQTVIGNNADGVKDNSVVIGNQDVTDIYLSEDAGATVHAANAKLNQLPSSNSDSIIVLMPDSTLAVRETSTLLQSFGQIGGSPVAFGYIDINGNVLKSTGNISASFSGSNTGNASTDNIYSVSVTGETLSPMTHIIFITPVMVDSSNPGYTRTSGVVFQGGEANIRFYSSGSVPTSAFNIIIYKYN